jgi:uncharacterized OB-fold protein
MTGPAPIRPEAEGLAAVYWSAVQEERLLLQRCARGGHVWHPPSEYCPACQDDAFVWVEACGEGVIHSYTVVHHAAHAAVTAWLPYTVLLVDLHEGPRMVARLVDALIEPEIGAPVRLRFERYSDLIVPAFALA